LSRKGVNGRVVKAGPNLTICSRSCPAPHAHPNECCLGKKKATQKSPFAYLVGSIAHAKTASKDHQKPHWEQSQTSKRAKNRQKDRFFSHGFTL
ncbi:hypothetical protein, partial [Aeromonas veronii]|uniref:hypothetical protein n=1 Tax=Aeromonas veronii TaxID=654 RepID=UPI003004A653